MYYFAEHRIGHFHIPKTGGQSLSHFLIKSLGKRGDLQTEVQRLRWHEPIGVKRDVLGHQVFDSSTFITTVRNPYATAVSLYFWNKLKVAEQHPDLGSGDYPSVELIADMEFGDFMDWYVENAETFEDYLLLEGKIPGNLRIARLESLAQDLDRIVNSELTLGLRIKLHHKGRTQHDHFMSYLEPRDIVRLNEKQAWAFENFYPDDVVRI